MEDDRLSKIQLPLALPFCISAASFGLHWTIHVIITRSIFLLPNHMTPTLSDASHNRWQHPYFVLSMTTSMLILFCSSFLCPLLQRHDNKKWKKYVINGGLASAIGATTTTAISSAIFVETTVHYVFASAGAVLALLWVMSLAIVLPLPENRPWINSVMKILAVSSAVGLFIGLAAVYLTNYRLGAVGEYIGFSSITLCISCIAFKAIGIKIRIGME